MPRGGSRRGAGRKPKPTRLKILEGNPGERPLNTKEPKFPVSPGDPPDWLDAVAQEEWRRLAPSLLACGLLQIVDRTILAAYCKAYSRWRQAEELIEKSPSMMMKAGDRGYQKLPHIQIANRYLDQMRSIATEFGFTPASRSRLEVEPMMPAGNHEGKGKAEENFFGYGGESPIGGNRQGPHAVRGSA